MQTAHNECAVCIFVSERRARGMRKRGRTPRPFPYLFYLGKEEERQKGRLSPRRPGRGGGPGGSRRGKRTAGPARRKEKAAGQGKGGGARERRRNAAKATRRERAEPRRETTRPQKTAKRQEKTRDPSPRIRGRVRRKPARNRAKTDKIRRLPRRDCSFFTFFR